MKKDIENSNFPLSDDELRKAFHRGLPEAPVTAWFTRKVMNRLPVRRRRMLSLLEWVTYGVSAAALLVFWGTWLASHPRDNMPSGDYPQAQPDTPPTTPIPGTPTTPKAQPTQVVEVEEVIVENGDDDSRDNINIPPIPRRD